MPTFSDVPITAGSGTNVDFVSVTTSFGAVLRQVNAIGDASTGNNVLVVNASGEASVHTADGSSVTLGATTDAAATSDSGTFSLMALLKRLLGKLPAALGQTTKSASLSVTLASDQGALLATDTRAVGALIQHRVAVTSADGTTAPAASAAGWAANPGGYSRCRVFCKATGGPSGVTFRPYLRSGASSGQVGPLDLLALGGSPNYLAVFDVQVDGDDLYIYVETLTGGTSPTVSVYLSWR